MTQHIRVGMSRKSGFVRNLHATNNERPPGFQAMQVVSGADSREWDDVRSGIPVPMSASTRARSCCVVILMLVDSPSTRRTEYPPARRATPRRSRPQCFRAHARWLLEHVAGECLRRLRQVHRFAIDRARDDPHAGRRRGFLHGIACLKRRDRRASFCGRVDHAREQIRARERTRGVMNDDDLRAFRHLCERFRDGILPPRAAIDDAHWLARRNQIGGRRLTPGPAAAR